MRKKYVALWRRGTYAHLYARGMVYVFARTRDQHTVIVGLNAGHSEARLDLDVQCILLNGATVHAEWSGQQLPVTDGYVRGLTIPARDGGVRVGSVQ